MGIKRKCFIFRWIAKLFYIGTQRSLKLDDLYKTLECDQSQPLGNKLEQQWLQEVLKAKESNGSPSLLRAINRTFMKEYLICGLMVFIMVMVLR